MPHAFRPAPMSNTERQRKFRAANPGYFNKYNSRRKARRITSQKKVLELFKGLAKARAAASQQQQQQQQPASLTLPPPKPVLMLPAPVRDPAMEALDALAASLKANAARQPLPAAAATTHFADPSRAA